jgi:hypothetical protein
MLKTMVAKLLLFPNAARKISGLVQRILRGEASRYDRVLSGKIIKNINIRKAEKVGNISNDIDMVTKHFSWLKSLETTLLKTKEVPRWLVR